MTKYTIKQKLPKKQLHTLLLGLCEALTVVKNLEEAASLLTDLMSLQEQQMLAKRLQIAKLLLEEKTFDQIERDLKVGRETIARVNGWLQAAGQGYRLIFERRQKSNVKIPEYRSRNISWGSLKRKYPMYYWPQLLLEDLVRNANNRQRTKLLNTIAILKKSNQKYPLFKEIEQIIQGQRTPRRQEYRVR